MKSKKQATGTTTTVSNNNNNKNSYDLPFDLIFDILTRLPVKSLLKFKTVCKTWYSLVQNPTFIKLHHTRSKLNTNPTLTSVLLLVINSYYANSTTFTMRLQSRDKNHVPNPNISFEHRPRILGICDGLVCVTSFGNSETIIICNPTIGRVRKVPRFFLPEKGSSHIVFNGFGLKDDDYKLFRIVYPSFGNEVVVRAEVYSMNTGTWRDIGVVNNGVIDPDVGWQSFNLVPVAINDVFYWVAFSSNYTYLASFDMKGYVFSVIFCPGLIRPSNNSGQLVDLKGELVTLFFDTLWFELWGFNDKDRSWTLKIRTCYHPSISGELKCLGCEGNGNLLMRYYSPEKDIKLFSYDPESLDIMDLSFGILKEDYNEVYLYVESLLLV